MSPIDLPVDLPPARGDPARDTTPGRRVIALDGLRGLMTIVVVMSHYFGEVPHGLSAFMMGWIAVDMFFVLSGYLVGKLIIEKGHASNFLPVFYVRRACRTLPIYMLCVLAIFGLVGLIDRPWAQGATTFPLWSYLTFNQNVFMAAHDAVGHEWLGPTWTMGLEEHFYLVLPLLFLLVPRRRLAAVLCAMGLAALLARAGILLFAPGWWMTTLVFLPTRADILVCGVLGALALAAPRAEGRFSGLWLRLAAPALLAAAGLSCLLGDGQRIAFAVFGPLAVSLGCTAFLMTLVVDAPEAERFRSPILRFFGTTSYAVYLTHMPVLGLMHGFILDARPDVGTPVQWVVTVAALPVCVAVGWLLTVLVEAPISAYGRGWRWRERGPAARAPLTVPGAEGHRVPA